MHVPFHVRARDPSRCKRPEKQADPWGAHADASAEEAGTLPVSDRCLLSLAFFLPNRQAK